MQAHRAVAMQCHASFSLLTAQPQLRCPHAPPHLPRGGQRLRQVLGALHNLNHALLINAQLGRLRQRVRDAELDQVVVAQPVVDCSGGWVGTAQQG
jgi:hypothetical protein